MKILDARWRELARGYETVCDLEQRLKEEWATPIEKVRRQEYARRLEIWKTGISKLSPQEAAVQRRYERQYRQWQAQHKKFPPLLEKWKTTRDDLRRRKNSFHRWMILGLAVVL